MASGGSKGGFSRSVEAPWLNEPFYPSVPRASMGAPPPRYTPTPDDRECHGQKTRIYMKKLKDEKKQRVQEVVLSEDEYSISSEDSEEGELLECEGDYRLLEEGDMKVFGPTIKTVFEDELKKIRKVEIGERQPGAIEKVIMLVGATGSGKTTLINGMYNYIVGVNWNDDYRLKLIEENTGANQAKSQTSWITAYTVHHKSEFTVPFTLTIIDTPGFGDTSGIQRDQQITEQIRTCFLTQGPHGIDSLDAVGFVAQSSLPRLTPPQRYIFDSILSLFGKDIADNIFMLLTFADGQKPQVLSGLKEAKMPFKKSFKFNNSALFISNRDETDEDEDNYDDDDDDDDDDKNFNEICWRMGNKSFRVFMTELGKAQSKSLVLTKNVLEERHRLEVTMEGIQRDVKMGLGKLEELRVEHQILDQHQTDIDKNKNFTYTVDEQFMVVVEVSRGQYTTNCIVCNVTCHKRCIYNNDNDKAKCSAMQDGKCTNCDLNCHWTMHRNQPFVYELRVRTVTKEVKDLKKRYQEAYGKKLTSKELVKRCKADFDKVQMRVLTLVDQARKIINTLNKIALRMNPLSTVGYIEILIKGEKTEGKPGWKERMDQLQEVKEKAVQMQALEKTNYDPLAAMKKQYDDERKQRQLARQFQAQLNLP